MILVVDNYATFIGKESERFKLTTGDKKEEYAASNLKQIVVTRASGISFGAIKLAMESSIDIVYLGKRGNPSARIYPCKLGGTTLTRRLQLEAYYNEKGAFLAKAFISAKIKNQASLLRSLGKARKNTELIESSRIISKNLLLLNELNGSIDSIRQKLLGIEGNSSSIYFGALARILPFERRDRKARDPFNVFLNYGYGMLYSEIERACIIAGLDPYLGFLHTDRYGKPSMTLDLIEEFRQPIVDRAIVTFFSHKLYNETDLEKTGDAALLSETGKRKILEAVLERLSQNLTFCGESRSLSEIIVEQARNITRFLQGRKNAYEGFVARW